MTDSRPALSRRRSLPYRLAADTAIRSGAPSAWGGAGARTRIGAALRPALRRPDCHDEPSDCYDYPRDLRSWNAIERGQSDFCQRTAQHVVPLTTQSHEDQHGAQKRKTIAERIDFATNPQFACQGSPESLIPSTSLPLTTIFYNPTARPRLSDSFSTPARTCGGSRQSRRTTAPSRTSMRATRRRRSGEGGRFAIALAMPRRAQRRTRSPKPVGSKHGSAAVTCGSLRRDHPASARVRVHDASLVPACYDRYADAYPAHSDGGAKDIELWCYVIRWRCCAGSYARPSSSLPTGSYWPPVAATSRSRWPIFFVTPADSAALAGS